MQYRIHEANYLDLRHKVDKLTKRANKLGVGEITLKDVGEEMVEELRCHKSEPHRCEDLAAICSTKVHVKYITVELEGETPKFAGWEFLATLQHAGEAGTVIRAVPGALGDMKAYREAVPWCEHCKQNRVRRDTFLVYNTERCETKQVGSSCIKDFTGHSDPHALARYLEVLAGAAELLAMGSGGSGFGEAQRLDLEQFLATTAAFIRAKGWLSRTKAHDEGGDATADRALAQALNDWKSDDQRKREFVDVTEADVAEAEEALVWAQAIDPATDNDYMANILVVSRVPAMELRSAGLAASIVASYRRERARERDVATWLTKGPGAHIGEEKQRLELVVRVDGEPQTLETEWGASYLYRFEDEKGNSLVTFSSRMLCFAEKEAANGEHLIRAGDTVRIKATVKRHNEFRGRNQTQLTRVKVVGPVKSDTDAGKGFDDLCRASGIPVKADAEERERRRGR